MDMTATFEVIATVLLLAGAVGLGVAVFVWARRWRQELAEEPTNEAQIESYRHMLDQGLIDDDEYDRIVAQLRPRLPMQPAAPPQPEQPGSPPEPPAASTP